MVNIFGWTPLIIFWLMQLNGIEKDWMIALPIFACGVFIGGIFSK